MIRYFLILFVLPLACCTRKHLPDESEAAPATRFVINHSASATPLQMNVFYIGVDNSLSVFITGVSSNDYVVSTEPGTIEKERSGVYNVRVSHPGEVKVTVSTSKPDVSLKQTFLFRAKRIPDPVPTLNGQKNRAFGTAEFRQLIGLLLVLENFDFDARCETVSYTVTRLSLDGNRQMAVNEGARFGEAAKALVAQAQSGDVYVFSDILATCPGDEQSRQLNNVAYFVR